MRLLLFLVKSLLTHPFINHMHSQSHNMAVPIPNVFLKNPAKHFNPGPSRPITGPLRANRSQKGCVSAVSLAERGR